MIPRSIPRNPGVGPGGIIGPPGFMSGIRLAFSALTYDPDTYEMLGVKTGTGDLTVARTTTQYVLDHEGVYQSAAANSPAWYGARKVENLLTYSEDFSNATWTKLGTANVTGTNTINLPAELDYVNKSLTTGVNTGRSFVARITVSGSGTITLAYKRQSGTLESANLQITLSSTPTTYALAKTFSSANSDIYVQVLRASGDTATQVTVASIQFEESTGRTDTTTPSEYIPTTSAAVTKWYANTNGNTVASNVVTEATGTLLSPLPMLQVDPALTNSLFNSRDLTGWTQTGTAVSAYNAVGLTGAANTATTLTDDDGAGFEYVQKNGTVPNDANYNTLVFYVKKDTVTPQYVGAECRLSGGTAQKYGIIANTLSGAVTGSFTSVGTVAAESESAGGFWKFYVSVLNNNSGNTVSSVLLYPTISTDGTTTSAAATGSVIIGNVELYLNKTIAQVRGAGPIFTTTAAVTTGAQTTSFDIANHSDDNGAYYFDHRETIASTESLVLGVGTHAMLNLTGGATGLLYRDVTNNRRVTHDGTNYVTHSTQSWGAGDMVSTAITYSASAGEMDVNVNGVWDNDPDGYDGSYAISSGFIQLFANVYPLRVGDLRRYEGGTYNNLKAKIDELMP